MPCTAVQHRHRDRPTLELADVFRQCSDPLSHLDGKQARVVRAILSCRTAALGGHIQQCDRCDHNEIACNSCRDRHCPKCQGSQQFRWLEAQQQHLLPIEYHHVVFTVPDTLRALFRANPRRCYGLLFAAVAETLHDVARNPKNLGATIGFSCVLHTWTQTLLFHPHIHCIVTGGGLDADRRRWIASRRGFLFPVRILAQLFRAKLLSRLESGLDDKTLRGNDVDPHARLRAAARKDWVVYSKPPFAGPRQVLRYLGRYTHRVAISNRRLVTLDHDHVTFRWNDRARGNPKRLMKLRRAGVLSPFPAPHLAFRTDAHPTLRTARQPDTTQASRTLPGTPRTDARALGSACPARLAPSGRTTSWARFRPLPSMPNRSAHPRRLMDVSSTSTVNAFPELLAHRWPRAIAVDAPVCASTPKPGSTGRSVHHRGPHPGLNLISDVLGLLPLPVKRPTPNNQPAGGLEQSP